MNVFESILISSCAVAYASELFALPFSKILISKLVANTVTLPMAFLSIWFLGYSSFFLFLYSFSVAFMSTAFRILVNVVVSKTQANQPVTRRNYRGINEGF